MKHNVIAIGYGRHNFIEGNPERERLALCATEVAHFDLIIFSKKNHGLQTQVVSEHLTLHPTNSSHSLFSLIDSFFIARRLLRQTKNEVVVTTQDPFETALVGLLLKWLYRPALIMQEHGDFFGLSHWRRESFGNQLRYRFGLYALRCADRVRVVSLRTKKLLEARGITNIATLPVAVDAAPFLNAHADEQVRNLFGDNTFVFLSVARFVPQKNFPLLLQAFATAFEQNNSIRLLLVGTGKEQSRIRSIMSQFPKETQAAIAILPWSNNVAGLMKASSAYVLSSNYEGWGRVLIEAVLAQLPIVTTAVGCADEVIVDEAHGLVVPVGDATALAQALVRISTDTELYAGIKDTLVRCSDIPGADMHVYKKQWAAVFAPK